MFSDRRAIAIWFCYGAAVISIGLGTWFQVASGGLYLAVFVCIAGNFITNASMLMMLRTNSLNTAIMDIQKKEINQLQTELSFMKLDLQELKKGS